MATKKTPSRDEFAAELKKVKAETEKEITKKAEEVKAEAKKATIEVKEAAKKTADNAKASAKKTASKAVASTKLTAKKTVAAAKKKVEEKTAEVKVTAVVQFAGRDFKVDDIVKKVEEAYKAENQKKALKSLDVYIKPEDGAAYYVANDGYAGKVNL